MNSEIRNSSSLVSCCWLYCGSCKKFLQHKCPGCKNKEKTPFWCTIRDCCLSRGYENCAQCDKYPDPAKCLNYNGFVIKTLAFCCGSDRLSATKMIKEKGIEGFAEFMSEKGWQRINRKK